MARRRLAHLLRLGGGQANRFFTQYVLARFERPKYPLFMQRVRQRNINRLNGRVGEQRRIITVAAFPFAGWQVGLMTRCDTVQARIIRPRNRGNNRIFGNSGIAQYAPVYDGAHLILPAN